MLYMSKTERNTSRSSFTIVDALDETGTVTVRENTTGQSYEIDTFATETVRERVKTLSPGCTVGLVLTPNGMDETITRLSPGTPVGPFGAD
jgi:hypothetical protein